MSIYLYELPTTGAVSFADFCVDGSPQDSHTAHMAEATQARANLRGALKENKRADRDEKDYLKLVKVLDDYLPYLRGIMNCVDSGEIAMKYEPIFSWRTTLSANINPLNTSPRLSIPSLYADLAFSLLTYAFALSNLAYSIVNSLGNYERERAISDIERKTKDEKLNFAVTLLCRAAGIFSYLSDSVLLDWSKIEARNTGNVTARPPDMHKEVNAALAKLAIADAQSLAIRKLLSKSAYDSTLTPGPPLPKSHPSPALIAKLHLECASLYSSARSLAMTPGKSRSSSGTSNEISIDLRRYLAESVLFHNALARKWLGVDAGENGGRQKGGEAVAFLIWAKKDLEDLKDSGKSLGIGKEKEQKERKKQKVLEELENVNVFLKHYKKVNDSLSFQPVPPQMDLQACIPAGRLAVAVKPFSSHIPAFGPGSVEHARRQIEELSVLEPGVESEQSSDADKASPFSRETYAGAGSYF
ncbi:hypothetical protein SERLA73DRAFT_88380 [Serpula lacrymans var. lacrymans S7.3]|uniref:pH-response regulator protein palC n=2 Tax=Serpula lacrymans var. lacrymans TaxID=341189 RepID=F8PV59_SERL3|nr:uncharacterized protein SERLADRAFT_448301 [Serpula lacrymans var. lacrymans S7.9]EGN99751.1 hypothetical protein SERLA73DRAFT_88380 [Serpula lacrymans var. lacrymans S7.3]EGO25323.1 hypothetical protein SERLADRAFT_448301 [Serpula lacrymans var. lacrymans S7.9]